MTEKLGFGGFEVDEDIEIMTTSTRLSDKEYEALSLEYAKNTPQLSGTPGFMSNLREQ